MSKKWFWFVFFTLLTLRVPAQDTGKMCPGCQHLETRTEARFCIYCGYELIEVRMQKILVCPKCQVPLDEGGSFCALCGARGEWISDAVPAREYEPEGKRHPDSPSGERPPSGEPAKEGKIPAYPSPTVTRALPSDVVIYPGATLLRKYDIEEGLYHTSRQRSVVKKLFVCEASLEDVEKFYRSQYKDLSVMKTFSYNVFQMIHLKRQFPHFELRIDFYSLAQLPPGEMWTEKRGYLKSSLDRRLEAPRNVEKQILDLQEKFRKKEVEYVQIEDNLERLREQHHVLTNSPSYWNHVIMERCVDLQKNLLCVTVVTPK